MKEFFKARKQQCLDDGFSKSDAVQNVRETMDQLNQIINNFKITNVYDNMNVIDYFEKNKEEKIKLNEFVIKGKECNYHLDVSIKNFYFL